MDYFVLFCFPIYKFVILFIPVIKIFFHSRLLVLSFKNSDLVTSENLEVKILAVYPVLYDNIFPSHLF